MIKIVISKTMLITLPIGLSVQTFEFVRFFLFLEYVMSDEIETDGGAYIGDIASGGGPVVARDDASQRQSVIFNNSDNATLWSKLISMTEQSADQRAHIERSIIALKTALDDLPNRVGKLEVIVRPASAFQKMLIAILLLMVVVVTVVAGVVLYMWFHK